MPSRVVPPLTEALDAVGVNYRLKTWPGTHHGFSFPPRPTYNTEAAETMWQIMFDLYARWLQTV